MCMGRGLGVPSRGAPELLGHRIFRGSDTSARTQRMEVGENLPLLRNRIWSMLGREHGIEAGKTAGHWSESSRKLLGFAARDWRDLPLGRTSLSHCSVENGLARTRRNEGDQRLWTDKDPARAVGGLVQEGKWREKAGERTLVLNPALLSGDTVNAGPRT